MLRGGKLGEHEFHPIVFYPIWKCMHDNQRKMIDRTLYITQGTKALVTQLDA